MKIADFGLSRVVENCKSGLAVSKLNLVADYRKRDMGMMPIRWMAPESLREGENYTAVKALTLFLQVSSQLQQMVIQ